MEHSATSFIKLVNLQPTSFIAYVIMFVLVIDLELKAVVDLSIVYQTDSSPDLVKQYSGSMVGQDGVIYNLTGITNIFWFARSGSQAITLILILALLSLYIWLAWWLFVPKESLSFTAGEGESEKKIAIQTKVASFILHHFEYFFMLSVVTFTQSVTCFSTTNKVKRYSSENTLITLPNQQNQNEEILTQQSSYNDLNTSITCKSVTHIYLMIFTSLILLMAILFKYINHKLLSYRPNPDFILSKYGVSDNLHNLIMLVLLILKTIIKSFPGALNSSVVIYFGICFALGGVDLIIQTLTYPYYSKTANRFRYAESLVISLVSLHALLNIAIENRFTRNQIYLLLSCALIFVVLLKCADNIELLIDEKNLLGRRVNTNNRKVLSFVYLGLKYLDACLLGNISASNSLEFQKILFYFMTENKSDKKNIQFKKWNLAKKYIDKTGTKNPTFNTKESIRNRKARTQAKTIKGLKFVDPLSFNSKISKIEFEQSKSPPFNYVKQMKGSPLQEGLNNLVKITKLPPIKSSDGESNFRTAFSIDANKAAINNIHDPHGSKISINGIPLPENLAKELDKFKYTMHSPGNTIKRVLVDRMDDIIKEAKDIKSDNLEKEVRGLANSLTVISNDERVTKDATFVLFDSFSESKKNAIKMPIMMLNDMLEEHLYNLLNTPGVEFRRISELLNTYVYFKLNYLGGAYQLSIKIRELEKRYSLINKDRLFVQNKISFRLLYAMIKIHIKNNLETGNLILPHLRNYMSFELDQKNIVKLYDVTQFINIYTDIKILIKKLTVNKSKFLQGLLNNGADFKEIFSQTNIYTKYQLKLNHMFQAMVKKSRGKFTPLMMIYGSYLYYIQQNIGKARRILREYVAKKFFFDLRNISDMSLAKNDEMMTLGCSMEKENFHMINMVSCNVFFQLEYDAFELIGQDLSVLVPKPLSDYHKDLLLPQNLTGVLFEKKTLEELPIKKKNGFMTICKATFRMNYRIDSCLEVFTALVFDKENQNLKNLIVVDEAMMITEVSEVCTDHFQKGTFIYQYNKKFYEIFENLNYVSHFRLKHGNIDLKTLMKDSDILERYYTYFTFLNGEDIEIKDKNGVKRFINIRIIVNYMPSVQKFIRFVEYDLLKEEDVKHNKIKIEFFDEDKSSGGPLDLTYYNTGGLSEHPTSKKYDFTKLDKAEVKVKNLLDYLYSCTILQAPSKTLHTMTRDDRNRSSSGGTLRNQPTPVISKSRNRPRNVKEPKSQIENDIKMNEIIKSKVSLQGLYTTVNLEDDNHKNNITFEKGGSHENRNSLESSKVIERGNDKHQDTSSLGNNQYTSAKMRNRNKGSEDSRNKRSTTYKRMAYKESKVHEYMMILHEKIRTLSSNIMFIILIGYLFSSLLFQALMGYQKYHIQQKVGKEILYHLSAVDDTTLAFNSVMKTLDLIDFNRNVFSGVIARDYLSQYGIKDMIEANSKESGSLKFVLQSTLNKANKKMIGATINQSEYIDSFSYSPRVNGTSYNESRRSWEPIHLTFRSMGSFLQPLIDSYATKDLKTIEKNGPKQNPKGDINEQTLRINLGGAESKIIYKLTLLSAGYFRYLTQYSKNFLLTSELLSILSVLLVAVIVLLYAFLLRLKMKSVYMTIFQFRVNLFDKARRH